MIYNCLPEKSLVGEGRLDESHLNGPWITGKAVLLRPAPLRICTSHVERDNGTARTFKIVPDL